MIVMMIMELKGCSAAVLTSTNVKEKKKATDPDFYLQLNIMFEILYIYGIFTEIFISILVLLYFFNRKFKKRGNIGSNFTIFPFYIRYI